MGERESLHQPYCFRIYRPNFSTNHTRRKSTIQFACSLPVSCQNKLAPLMVDTDSSFTRAKKGKKPSSNQSNEFCRLCKKSLRILYGDRVSHTSYSNIFRAPNDPSKKPLSESLKSIGIIVENEENCSQVVCGTCGRKLPGLYESFTSVHHS